MPYNYPVLDCESCCFDISSFNEITEFNFTWVEPKLEEIIPSIFFNGKFY